MQSAVQDCVARSLRGPTNPSLVLCLAEQQRVRCAIPRPLGAPPFPDDAHLNDYTRPRKAQPRRPLDCMRSRCRRGARAATPEEAGEAQQPSTDACADKDARCQRKRHFVQAARWGEGACKVHAGEEKPGAGGSLGACTAAGPRKPALGPKQWQPPSMGRLVASSKRDWSSRDEI